MIEALLRVAHAIEQLAAEPARATFQITDKIDHVAHNQFCCRAWRRRAKIGDEIANRKIDFVSYGGDDWNFGRGNRSGDNFFVELPKVFNAAAAARDDDQIDRREIFAGFRELADCDRDFLRRTSSLNADRADQD